MEIIKAKLDVVFKKLFTSDDEVLKGFVSDILDIPRASIKQITVDNPNIFPLYIDGKQSELDLKMHVDDQIVNVEMQICNRGNYRERALYYWAKTYSDELKKSEDYLNLKKTISVNILDFNLFDCDSAYSRFSLLEETRYELLTDKCSLLFFELTKIDDKVDTNDRKKLWMQLINAETEGDLAMLNNTGVPEIQKAVVILHEMSADEEMREIARLREKAELDERSAINTAKREGRAEGIARGRAEEREKLAARLRGKGYTEQQIQDILGE